MYNIFFVKCTTCVQHFCSQKSEKYPIKSVVQTFLRSLQIPQKTKRMPVFYRLSSSSIHVIPRGLGDGRRIMSVYGGMRRGGCYGVYNNFHCFSVFQRPCGVGRWVFHTFNCRVQQGDGFAEVITGGDIFMLQGLNFCEFLFHLLAYFLYVLDK